MRYIQTVDGTHQIEATPNTVQDKVEILDLIMDITNNEGEGSYDIQLADDGVNGNRVLFYIPERRDSGCVFDAISQYLPVTA